MGAGRGQGEGNRYLGLLTEKVKGAAGVGREQQVVVLLQGRTQVRQACARQAAILSRGGKNE